MGCVYIIIGIFPHIGWSAVGKLYVRNALHRALDVQQDSLHALLNAAHLHALRCIILTCIEMCVFNFCSFSISYLLANCAYIAINTVCFINSVLINIIRSHLEHSFINNYEYIYYICLWIMKNFVLKSMKFLLLVFVHNFYVKVTGVIITANLCNFTKENFGLDLIWNFINFKLNYFFFFYFDTNFWVKNFRYIFFMYIHYTRSWKYISIGFF